MSRVRVYVACSLDGFIAGPDDDLAWLEPPDGGAPAASDEGGLGFEAFIAEVGAMLIGRRTYDVVTGMEVPWPYGELPVLVATRRPLEPAAATVRAAEGSIEELITEARSMAGDKDVYLDGGQLVRQALDAGLVDELILTVVPVVLGAGIPLLAGAARREDLEIAASSRYAGRFVQLTVRPARS